MDLPPYILLSVFEHLPGRDLIVATHTCRLWSQLILSRRRLRANAFLPSPAYTPPYALTSTELHPVISQLHFDDTTDPEAATFGRNQRLIKDSPVKTQMATCPAVTELRLDVMKYHPHVVVTNPSGVTVEDVVKELAKYKSVTTNFTYDDFFGREICSKRKYERRKHMRRADMVGSEKVVVTFGPPTVFDGTVLFSAERFAAVNGGEKTAGKRKGRKEREMGKEKDGHRFWSAFAFET
ncbi:hypothetical protein K440DRAFT_655151 [Wilcoxina mikolae CBS 423.85]|nr:hypothetical protein K440DRAFT_655151 [Wilcoxina mikolae CBS 423.85]